MSKWLAFLNGVIVGPFTQDKIENMFHNGEISATDKISREGELFWKTISDFPELQHLVIQQDNYFTAADPAPPAEPHGGKKNLSTLYFGKKDANSNTPAVAIEQSLNGSEVHFRCPYCRQKYMLDAEEFNGQSVDCPGCSKAFILQKEFEQDMPVMEDFPESPVAQESFPAVENVDFTEDIPEGDITCPHCWKTFSKENICYISTHPDLIGDSIVGEFEQKRFVPTVYHSSGLPLDAKGMPCTDIACPHCHLRIPASIVDLSSLYVSIAGAPSSGKSYFLTSLVHTLRSTMPVNNFSFYDVDPIINSVLNDYEEKLFMAIDSDSVTLLPKTQQTGTEYSNRIVKNNMALDLPKPFIFRLQSISASSNGEMTDRNLIFYDNAGEHFQPGADTINNPATIHLAHSDSIVFIFDPVNDANMRKECDKRDPQLENTTKVNDQTTLFAEMVNRIRRHGNFNINESCDIPLIIAVNKYDTWKQKLPKDVENISFFCENQEDFTTELNMNAILDVSFALRELMQSAAPALVAQAEAFFKRVFFIPVSSFGCLACKDSMGNIGIIPSKIKPILVDLPVSLLLGEKGIMPCNNTKPSVSASPLVCKIIDNQIVFKHPVSGRRVSLPPMYSEAVLEIGGKIYKMPHLAENTAAANEVFSPSGGSKSSVWE
ncbi:MAG: DUF4339 domain-containing protein [Lentisphaeria bacterium]|nr:DUF4339 domain-containing protein [Lentisphaeria bacterium]